MPADEVRKILSDLGCTETHNCDHCVKVAPPTWRADLTREADLVEEVARIHGYDKIPVDSTLAVVPSAKRQEDVVIEKVRGVLAAGGFDEALTLSTVEPETNELFRPWATGQDETGPLATGTAVLRRANTLRQSVVPSLLACRRTNETLSNPVIELYEIAKVYLPSQTELPTEKRVLALTSGGGFLEVKGILEAIASTIAPESSLEIVPAKGELLDATRSCGMVIDGAPLCLLGELSESGRDRFDLRGAASVAELDLGVLIAAARGVPQTHPLSNYPPVSRDLNVVVEESIRWSDIERVTRDAGGDLVELIAFQDDSYRDPKQLGEGKKSVVFRVQLRSTEGTLKSEQADTVVGRIVAELGGRLGGTLRA